MFKLAPEGYPFITIFAVLSVITAVIGPPWMVAVPLVLTAFMIYFFRDPDRVTTESRDLFYAPADGKVILIQETEENELLNKRALEVSIFMDVFNVHVNRAPCAGTVKEVERYPGRFIAAFKHDASMVNEHITMLMETEHGDVVVRQVAGLLARRAVCRVKPGASLKQGQRYGIIKFSSRLDVFLPLNTRIKVKLNDKVKAGESILGIIE
ncbi:MAG TPA: phosphatidylserine decarboxylase family protein [Nitrospirae bacterium]|nr:phosphatidylserine decarboxylase [bacterium BMS3Abin10]GBE38481.1 phosphatidylserine decarboxylase [bacterium BMS3Bbin08]HDH00907.1 phosphatidylserine decarboxylase family protein [Nitrospirota bacterium]HDH50626.1 phosphatidylserine decarboxylase family protein [Nitrospirota bacterium]HDK81436.1 phosphatidylserine decarboxylase family protein [Nitrospirota bacterium]